MWCLVTLPNSVILEVRVDPKSIGQDVLQKVCENLSISNETDYFGLKFTGSKGEELWLNLRNPIERQAGSLPPLRFAMRVKFWVPPHLLLQESTRQQFYLHARLDLLEQRLQPPDWQGAARLLALIAQAEAGDYDSQRAAHAVYAQYGALSAVCAEPRPQDFLHKVQLEHRQCHGMKPATAQYWLLKHLSNLDSFGEEMFYGKAAGAGELTLGVGPHGISVYSREADKQTIPYTAIQSASSHRRVFRLEYVSPENQERVLEVKQDSSQTASGLYRAITEKHAFYSCETVRSAVTAQYIRDFKGTIVSIFNEDSSLGKKYVFDIRRTCREVYDNARRALYQGAAAPEVDVEQEPSEGRATQDTSGQSERCPTCHERDCRESHERLARLLDAMTCRICMDQTINTAFLPCAHVLACSECAARCDRCPLCRGDIAHKQRIYLPTEFAQQQHTVC